MEISVPVQNQKTLVHEPIKQLVRLISRNLYDNHQKSATTRSETIINCLVLEALMRRSQWVKEEDLAKDLKINAKQLRKVLRHFEEEKLVTRYHRKETSAKSRDGRAEDSVKCHTHSYCCLDYSQLYDVVRCKLKRIKEKLKDGLEDKNPTIEEYCCPNCRRKYTALDALSLISMGDDAFHCEICNAELVVECKKLTSVGGGGGDNNAKIRQQEKLRVLLQNAETLIDQTRRLKDLPFPDFDSLPVWEARAAKAGRESQGLESKVEVMHGEGKEDVKSQGGGDSTMKQFPPWMITQRMNLNHEQRGDMIDDGVSGGGAELSDDKKLTMGIGDEKDYNKDYLIRAYYAALLQQQQQELAEKQQESAGVHLDTTSSDRQVGMKSKREEQDEEDEIEWEEDIEWKKEDHVAANGDFYKMDLNVEEEEQVKEAAPAVKFSKDTGRLKLINSIIKAPVGAQIKRVIDYLLSTRQAFTPEQIKEACYVDIHGNKAVFDSLRNNPRAHYDGRRFSYKAKHDVKDKSQLLSLVFEYPDGIDVADLRDAYLQIMEDLHALEASGDIIWLTSNTSSKEGIVYPDGYKRPIQVDDEFKSLYHDTDVPSDMLDVEKELRKYGLKPATDTAARRGTVAQMRGISMSKPKHKKKKKQKITNLTNSHLPELFQSTSRN